MKKSTEKNEETLVAIYMAIIRHFYDLPPDFLKDLTGLLNQIPNKTKHD